MSDEKPGRKTMCRKRIARKIQPKNFESVDISVECEDEIEWTTMAERDSKLKKLTELITIEFQDTFKKVCDELGLENKPAFGKRFVEGDTKPEQETSKQPSVDNELGSFADKL